MTKPSDPKITPQLISQAAEQTVQEFMRLGLRAAACIAVWKAEDGSLMSAAPSEIMDEPTMAAVAQLYRNLAADIDKRLPGDLQALAGKASERPRPSGAAPQKEPNVASTMLRAFVFCREARVQESGVDLVGIHDTRLTQTFPAQFPELSLYLSFKVLRREPVELALRVKLPNGAVHLVATTTVMPDASLVVLSPINLESYEFHMHGPHNFALHADGRLLAWSVLTISSPRDLVSPSPSAN